MQQSARISLRGYAIAAATLLAVIAFSSESWAREPKRVRCNQMTNQLANQLFADWNSALQQNPDAVTLKYATNAVLLPTVENGPLVGRAEIRTYFVHFLEKHPVGRIDTRNIIPADCNIGIVAGLYTFTLDGKNGGREDVPARYTYTYAYNLVLGRWEISHHHSSAQPVPPTPK